MTLKACPIPKCIGVLHKQSSPEAAARAGELAEKLSGRGIKVVTDAADIKAKADLVVVLGGDGTLIHAAGLLEGRDAPILGVNMGSLGFMTEIPAAEADSALDLVLAGKAEISERMKLRVHLHRAGQGAKKELDAEVLNDVVINKGALARMAELETTCDGAYVTTYRADGVIVATPTGSTAYALAANGPLVHPSMHAVVVAPICPHTLTQRPIVVPDDREINIALKSDNGEVFVTLDGQTGYPLKPGDRVQIKQSSNRVLLVRNPKMDYFGILRAKLKWGER